MRTTDDNQMLIVGKDDMFQRERDRLLPSKTRQREQAAGRLFPDLPFFTDYE